MAKRYNGNYHLRTESAIDDPSIGYYRAAEADLTAIFLGRGRSAALPNGSTNKGIFQNLQLAYPSPPRGNNNPLSSRGQLRPSDGFDISDLPADFSAPVGGYRSLGELYRTTLAAGDNAGLMTETSAFLAEHWGTSYRSVTPTSMPADEKRNGLTGSVQLNNNAVLSTDTLHLPGSDGTGGGVFGSIQFRERRFPVIAGLGAPWNGSTEYRGNAYVGTGWHYRKGPGENSDTGYNRLVHTVISNGKETRQYRTGYGYSSVQEGYKNYPRYEQPQLGSPYTVNFNYNGYGGILTLVAEDRIYYCTYRDRVADERILLNPRVPGVSIPNGPIYDLFTVNGVVTGMGRRRTIKMSDFYGAGNRAANFGAWSGEGSQAGTEPGPVDRNGESLPQDGPPASTDTHDINPGFPEGTVINADGTLTIP